MPSESGQVPDCGILSLVAVSWSAPASAAASAAASPPDLADIGNRFLAAGVDSGRGRLRLRLETTMMTTKPERTNFDSPNFENGLVQLTPKTYRFNSLILKTYQKIR